MWRIPEPLRGGKTDYGIIITEDTAFLGNPVGTNGNQSPNLYEWLGSPAQPADVIMTIDGCNVGAINITPDFPAGSTFQFYLLNGGRICGATGGGGTGGDSQYAGGNTPIIGEGGDKGSVGGAAILSSGFNVNIDADQGYLLGGGGGGGGGAFTKIAGQPGGGGGSGQGWPFNVTSSSRTVLTRITREFEDLWFDYDDNRRTYTRYGDIPETSSYTINTIDYDWYPADINSRPGGARGTTPSGSYNNAGDGGAGSLGGAGAAGRAGYSFNGFFINAGGRGGVWGSAGVPGDTTEVFNVGPLTWWYNGGAGGRAGQAFSSQNGATLTFNGSLTETELRAANRLKGEVKLNGVRSFSEFNATNYAAGNGLKQGWIFKADGSLVQVHNGSEIAVDGWLKETGVGNGDDYLIRMGFALGSNNNGWDVQPTTGGDSHGWFPLTEDREISHTQAANTQAASYVQIKHVSQPLYVSDPVDAYDYKLDEHIIGAFFGAANFTY